MRISTKLKFPTSLIMAIAITLSLAITASAQGMTPHAPAAQMHMILPCATSPSCTEVQNPEEVFGEDNYVGHDEPSNLFYSDRPGSGNQMIYTLKLPTDPQPGPGNVPKPGQSFNFQLHPAFWFYVGNTPVPEICSQRISSEARYCSG